MNINATITSATNKMVIIASRDNDTGFPRVVETKTPRYLKNWEIEPWIDCLEIRCAYKGQKWGLEQQKQSE